MRSYSESTNPRWAELLQRAVTEPGIVSQAFTRFHNYSMGNQLLAWCQCERRGIPPGPIATYPRWKELGRHVKKGERALTLCQPVTIKRTETKATDTEQTERTEQKDQCFTRFVYKNHWFVLSQTDGKEYTPEPLPGWDADTALSKLDIQRVPFTILDGNVQGYAKQRTVSISPLAQQPESTLFHELAHIVLGHTSEGSLNSDSTDRTPRDIRELEAECVALLCCESLDLPGAAESRGYIQSWFKGNEVPETSARKIFHAADLILKAGQTKQTAEVEA
jgi:antirestriction protein ArdC